LIYQKRRGCVLSIRRGKKKERNLRSPFKRKKKGEGTQKVFFLVSISLSRTERNLGAQVIFGEKKKKNPRPSNTSPNHPVAFPVPKPPKHPVPHKKQRSQPRPQKKKDPRVILQEQQTQPRKRRKKYL